MQQAAELLKYYVFFLVETQVPWEMDTLESEVYLTCPGSNQETYK